MDRFFLESIGKRILEEHKTERQTFLFTFVLGILLYFRMITQWLTNPDGVWQGLVYKSYYGWEDILGRVGLGLFNKIKGYYQFPTLQTIFCIAIAALLAVFLCDLLEIKRFPWNYMVGGMVVCSPSLCSTLTYYYTADAYLLAFLLAVLSVWCIAKKRTWGSYVLAVVLLAASASLYQAYIGSAITLCLLFLLLKMVRRAETVKQLMQRGLCFLVTGICGVLTYLLSYKVICRLWRISPIADRGFDSMGRIPLGRIPMLIKQAYHYFISYYFTDELYNNTWMKRGKVNVLIGMFIVAVLVKWIIKRQYYRKPVEFAILIMGILLIPMAFMSIVIMAPGCSIADVTGILMLPHMNWLYIFGIALIAEKQKVNVTGLVVEWTSFILMGGLLFLLGLYGQVFQNCMEMDLHRTYTLAQQIACMVNNVTEYVPGATLVIGGDEEQGNYPRNYAEMYQVVKGTAVEYGLFWNSANGRQCCWNQFFRQYMGVEYSVSTGEQLEQILHSEEYTEMPIFPAEGSVKVIDDCVVVKLSN